MATIGNDIEFIAACTSLLDAADSVISVV